MYLFLDIETADVCSVENPYPRLLQLAYCIMDSSRNIICRQNDYVLPTDFSVTSQAQALHHISNDFACVNGIPLEQVLRRFISFTTDVTICIAHNINFDKRILEKELSRFHWVSPFTKWKLFCTMRAAKPFCALKDKNGRLKNPSLSELYRI
jgi:DNA polymerase III alpha subunit (gram-positive type)